MGRELNPGVCLLNLETANKTDTNLSYGAQLHWWPPMNHTSWHLHPYVVPLLESGLGL